MRPKIKEMLMRVRILRRVRLRTDRRVQKNRIKAMSHYRSPRYLPNYPSHRRSSKNRSPCPKMSSILQSASSTSSSIIRV